MSYLTATRNSIRPAATAAAESSLLLPYTVIALWLILLARDTQWAGLVPKASLLRLLAPCVLAAVLLLPGQAAAACRANTWPWLLAFVALGAFSCYQSTSLILSSLKLGLYLAVMLPFCLSGEIRKSFSATGEGLWLLSLVAAALLALLAFGFRQGISSYLNNPNQVGMFTVCVAPLMLFHAHHRMTPRRALGRAGVALCVILCVASYARGAMLGLTAVMLIYFGLKRSPSIRSVIVIAVASAGALVAAFLVSDRDARHKTSVMALKGNTAWFDARRTEMMESSLEAVRERPFFGYGFGLSPSVTAEDEAYVLRTGRLSRVVGEFGNSTLALLVGGGLLQTGALAGLLAVVVLNALRSLRASWRCWPHDHFQIMRIAAMGGLMVQAQAEGWLTSPLTWPTFLFWLYVGAYGNPLPEQGPALPDNP